MLPAFQLPLGSLFSVQGRTGPTVPSGMRVRPWTKWRPAADGTKPDGVNAELLVHRSELVLLAKVRGPTYAADDDRGTVAQAVGGSQAGPGDPPRHCPRLPA